MRSPALILIVDDEPANRDILQTRLAVHGYDIVSAADGEEALALARAERPDLILLDVNMPKLDGMEVCRQLRADPEFPFTPIVMVTALADTANVVAGLELGADEYLTKPVDQAALVARVKSMLRIKELHDKVRHQADELAEQAGQLAEWNKTLEGRVREQIRELERLGQLKRFFSPQIVKALLSEEGERLLQSHRREITVVFLDLRGFTPFSESAAPEEVVEVLREYHAEMGRIIFEFDGTLEHFAGDGMMVFFNDPQPREDHGPQAARMALAMHHHMEGLTAAWKKRGHRLGFGVGIATGYATLGMIGFEGRQEYGAVGPVVNLAARLCEEAKAGEILISQRFCSAVEDLVQAEPAGELSLKGFQQPVPAFKLRAIKSAEVTERVV